MTDRLSLSMLGLSCAELYVEISFQQFVKKWLIFHLKVDILVVLWYIFNKGLKIHKVFI
jgi:hypothetical protein